MKATKEGMTVTEMIKKLEDNAAAIKVVNPYVVSFSCAGLKLQGDFSNDTIKELAEYKFTLDTTSGYVEGNFEGINIVLT